MSQIEISEKDLEKVYNDNHNAENVLNYGIKLLELEKLEKALTLYDFYFDSEEDTRKDEVEKYYVSLARECSRKNKNRDAIKCCEYYLDKESVSVNVLKLKIELLSHLKRFDEALICYDELIKVDDNDGGYNDPRINQIICLVAKAFYQYDKGLLKDSIDTLKVASEYYSNYELNVYSLNSWHKYLKTNLSKYADKDEEFFDNLFFVDAEDSMGWRDLIGYFTSHYDSYGDVDIMICDWLLEKNPESIPILNKKATLHANWKPTLSLKLYEKVLELKEYDLVAMLGKLRMFVKLKRYGKLYDYIQSLPSVYGISDVLSGITFDLI